MLCSCIPSYRAACDAQTPDSGSQAYGVMHLCTCWPWRPALHKGVTLEAVLCPLQRPWIAFSESWSGEAGWRGCPLHRRESWPSPATWWALSCGLSPSQVSTDPALQLQAAFQPAAACYAAGLLHACACVACSEGVVHANAQAGWPAACPAICTGTLPAAHDPALCPGTPGAPCGCPLQSPVHPVVAVHRPCCACWWPPLQLNGPLQQLVLRPFGPCCPGEPPLRLPAAFGHWCTDRMYEAGLGDDLDMVVLLGQRMSLRDAGLLVSLEFLVAAASSFAIARAWRPIEVQMAAGKDALMLGEAGRKAKQASMEKMVQVSACAAAGPPSCRG